MGDETGAAWRGRTYGSAEPVVVVLHGGPGAPGSAGPLASGLAEAFRVLEPWQGGSGGAPLTVACHVADLHALVRERCGGGRPALVGASWGAMLALAYAADHPDAAGPLVLVGCGTFDRAARARLRETLEARTDDRLRERLARVAEEFADPQERLRETYRLTKPLYACDAPPAETQDEPFDVRAHNETWADMVRLQEAGVYPGSFAAIRSPVLMLHGAYDPHPGGMIRDGLLPHLPQLEYREWARCGHTPWEERAVRGEFFRVLRDWLSRRLAEDAARP